MECCRCAVKEMEASLVRCPICHKMVCEECMYRRSGSDFCSRFCAEYFFFGGDEEEEDEEES